MQTLGHRANSLACRLPANWEAPPQECFSKPLHPVSLATGRLTFFPRSISRALWAVLCQVPTPWNSGDSSWLWAAPPGHTLQGRPSSTHPGHHQDLGVQEQHVGTQDPPHPCPCGGTSMEGRLVSLLGAVGQRALCPELSPLSPQPCGYQGAVW